MHCSASDHPEHDDISVIRSWHLDRGFHDVGYHYYIKKNGEIQTGRNLEIVGAHCAGFNSESVGICLGGEKEFTEEQFQSAAKVIDILYSLIPTIKKKYGILPHRFFNLKKTCPNYELSKVLKHLVTPINSDKTGKYL
jgi:N-acetyl-anhydromuramyl-L-alanine amidase AmpD